MPRSESLKAAQVSYMMQHDLRATHTRRTRVMVLATSVVVILIGAYWAGYFSFSGHWLMALAPSSLVVLGFAAWLLTTRKRFEAAVVLLSVSLFAIIIGMALLLDIPSPQIPRSIHHFLVPLAVVAYLMLKEENDWLAHGIPATCIVAFIILASSNFGILTPYALPDDVRRGGTWVNNFFSMAVLYLMLHVFSGDINRMERYMHTANNRFVGLVSGMFPRSIAERLLSKGETFAERHVNCTILFADIVGFTRIAERMNPEALVNMLAEIFAGFDQCVERMGLTKIKTIGDAYMVAAGVPDPMADHACVMVELAQEMLKVARVQGDIDLRIGIASGELVAGVIGQSRQVFDVWGDVVNVASRMESQGLPGRIQVSRSSFELTRHQFNYEPRTGLTLKGKDGLHEVYVLIQA